MQLIRNISLLTPCLPKSGKLLPYLTQIDDSHWYTNFGPLHQQYLSKLSKFFPDRYLTLTNNGTSALETALSNIGLKKNAKVLVPALTFPATVTAIIRLGYEPIIADIDEGFWQLTPKIAEATLEKENLDAVIPVATFGVPVDGKAWDSFAQKHRVKVIIDAAGAFGNQEAPEHCLTIFSLHATKALTAGEGGLIVSTSETQQTAFTRATNFGIAEDTLVYDGDKVSNAKLSEYHAAVGLASLDEWPETSAKRLKLLDSYLASIKNCGFPFTLQRSMNGSILSLFNLRFSSDCKILELKQYLQSKGIQSKQWYCPIIPEHPAFSNLRTTSELKTAKQISKSILGLPFHLQLTKSDIDYIAQTLADFFRKSVSASTKLVS